MRGISLRLAAALLTFALGVTLTAIYSMNRSSTDGQPTVTVTLELPFTPVAASCYPGRSLETGTLDKKAFFPPKVLSQDQPGNQFRTNWYSKHLRAMKEEPLYASDDGYLERYRFVWLRSFQHPVAVRIWKCGSSRFVTVKETNGAGGYEPGSLKLDRERRLTADEWSEFLRRLDESCYWELPTRDDDNAGFDGAQWIFEGVKEGRYHVVDRWTPQSGSYRELCLYALKLSGLKVDTDLY